MSLRFQRDLEGHLGEGSGEIDDRLIDGGCWDRAEVLAAKGRHLALVNGEILRPQPTRGRNRDPGAGDPVQSMEATGAPVAQQGVGACVEVSRHGPPLEGVGITGDANDTRMHPLPPTLESPTDGPRVQSKLAGLPHMDHTELR